MVQERLDAAAKKPARFSQEEEVSTPPELNREAEWQRQSQNFLALGFHIELEFADTEEGRQAYLDTLPKFPPQPKKYKGRFDQPLLVEKRIPWSRQAELAEITISDYLRARINQVQDWEDNHSKAPETAYCGWFNRWGQEFPDMIGPFRARDRLAPDAAGGDVYEGIAKQIHHPEENNNGQHFDLIGSQVGSGFVVYLCRWRGGSGLFAALGDDAGGGVRPLVRGSKVVTR